MGSVIRRNRIVFAVLAAIAAVFLALGIGVADSFAASSTDSATAQRELRTYAYSELGGNQYAVEGGGYMYGMDLFDNSSGMYDVNTTEYGKLSAQGQQDFVDDLMQSMNEAASSDVNQQRQQGTTNVTEQTTTNWLKELQVQPGMGTKILQETLGQTKPDFVSANEIYEPFSGPIGIAIALVAIIMMGLLALTLALDLLYITVPLARTMVKDDGKSNGKSVLISHEAIAAVKSAEDGEGKGVALWAYLKKRFVCILVLAFCLVLLIQGQIFSFVGSIVDLTIGLFNTFFGG